MKLPIYAVTLLGLGVASQFAQTTGVHALEVRYTADGTVERTICVDGDKSVADKLKQKALKGPLQRLTLELSWPASEDVAAFARRTGEYISKSDLEASYAVPTAASTGGGRGYEKNKKSRGAVGVSADGAVS